MKETKRKNMATYGPTYFIVSNCFKYILAMNLQYISLPLCVNTVSC